MMKLPGLVVLLSALLSSVVFSSEVEVINAGVGGNSSANLLPRVHEDVIAKHPDLVILMVGTNDALNSQKLTAPEVFAANLEKLVTEMTGSGSEVILMTIPPCVPDYLFERHSRSAYGDVSPGERIRRVNDIIREIAVSNGLRMVDLHALVQSHGGASTEADCLIRNEANSGRKDGVHPTEAGYRIVAEAIYEVLTEEGQSYEGQRIVCFGDSITYGAGMKKAGTADRDATTYPGRLALLLNP